MNYELGIEIFNFCLRSMMDRTLPASTYAPLAQLDRACGFGPQGYRFESCGGRRHWQAGGPAGDIWVIRSVVRAFSISMRIRSSMES